MNCLFRDECRQLAHHPFAVLEHRQTLDALHLGAGREGASGAPDVTPAAHQLLTEQGDVDSRGNRLTRRCGRFGDSDAGRRGGAFGELAHHPTVRLALTDRLKSVGRHQPGGVSATTALYSFYKPRTLDL